MNRTDTGVGHSGPGRAARLRSMPVAGTPESGAEGMSGDGAGAAVTPRRDAGLTPGRGGVRFPLREPLGKLKNWKPDAADGLDVGQDSRFSGFQVSTQLPSLRNNAERVCELKTWESAKLARVFKMNDWKGPETHRSLISYLLPLCRTSGHSHLVVCTHNPARSCRSR